MALYRLSEISDQSLTINYQTWICQSSVGTETFSSCARVREMVTENSTKMDAGERSPVGSTGSWHWTKTVLVVNSKTKRWNSLKYSTEQKGELNCGVADAEIVWGFVTMIDSFDVTQSIVISWPCDQFQCDMAQSKVGIPNFILSSASKIHQIGEQLYVAEWTQRNVSFSSFIVKVWVSLAAVSAEMIW